MQYKKEVVYITFMRDVTSRIMSQWRMDIHNLPDIFGKCKSFDYLFANSNQQNSELEGGCLKKGNQPVQYSDFATLMIGGCKWDGGKKKW